ncbi:MAG: hypothetical protein ACRD3T_04180 [Terriglobia bacterium]
MLRAVYPERSRRAQHDRFEFFHSFSGFDEVFRTVLGWDGLGFSFHIRGQEFSSFLRRTRTRRKALRDFQLRLRETFVYTRGGIDLWEWDFRLLASEAGSTGDDAPLCLATLRGGRLLLQTRTKVLNHELEEVFRRRHPLFRVEAQAA